jgi:hypothetical protein
LISIELFVGHFSETIPSMRFFASLLALAVFPLAAISCRNKFVAHVPAAEDSEMQELKKFYGDTRTLYNNRKLAELESLANDLRASKARFRSGAWKIDHFYTALACRDDEPESMWQLHEKIHHQWKTQFPKSITARVAHAQFMTKYAWHARGSGYAEGVTEDGWRLFNERLASARTILDQSKSLPPCPVWWSARFTVALGEGVDPADHEALFQEAKKAEPTFFPHDLDRAYYLLPRWHGKPGDWEAAAEAEIERKDGSGHESYARVVNKLSSYYQNIFNESKASWRKTSKGFDEMRIRYPDSKQILNIYCRMAYLAGDRKHAKKLFEEIGPDKLQSCWLHKGREFDTAKAWAM